jgi:DNA-binding NarL/FixJ family response regulator
MSGERPIRVLTVDDHPELRDGVAALLGGEADMAVVAEASDGAEAIEKYRSHRPDVTLMDIRMPLVNGTDSIQAIRREFPEARIIVMTTYQGDPQVVRAIRAGASGYLLKGKLRKELVELIRTVHRGESRLPPDDEV